MLTEDQKLRMVQLQVIELEDEIMKTNKQMRGLQEDVDNKLLPRLAEARNQLRAMLAN